MTSQNQPSLDQIVAAQHEMIKLLEGRIHTLEVADRDHQARLATLERDLQLLLDPEAASGQSDTVG